MTKYVLIGVLSILAFLLIACTPQEVSDRSVEEDILAAESGTVSGQAVSSKGSSIVFVSCTDSDGKDSYTRGNVQGTYTYKLKLYHYDYTDVCWKQKKEVIESAEQKKNKFMKVIEYTCGANNVPTKGPIRCAAGCVNGACVQRQIKAGWEIYPSLLSVKSDLQNKTITSIDGNSSTTEYQLVLSLLREYNGYIDNVAKETFFQYKLANYTFPYRNEKEYIIRIVHGLWLEENQVLPWSLRDYSQNEIAILFWVNGLNGNYAVKPLVTLNDNQYHLEYFSAMEEEAAYKLFLLAQKYKQPLQQDIIEQLIKWQKKNFFHAYYNYGWEVYRDGRSNIPPRTVIPPASLSRLFDERVTGCHENALLLTNLLRSLNIPAVSISIQGHGVTYLPTIDRYVHGDHIADFVTVPASDLLLTREEIIEIADVNSANSYDQFIYNKYRPPRHYFPNIELHRNNSNLLLETDSICGNIPSSDWELVRNEVQEYNLQYNQSHCKITSNQLPIQELSQLSIYP